MELLRTQHCGRSLEDDGSLGTCKVALHSFAERQVWDLLMFLTARLRSQDYYIRIIGNHNRTFQSIILGLKTWMFSSYFIKGLPPFKPFAVNTLMCFFGSGHVHCTSFLTLSVETVTSRPCTTGVIFISLPTHQSPPLFWLGRILRVL